MNLYLLKYGEIALKGKNRHFFEKALLDNIKKRTKVFSTTVQFRQGRIYLFSEDESVLPILKDTFGLVEVAESRQTTQDMDDIFACALEEMRQKVGDREVTFKVETKRTVKSYPLTSVEISAKVGGYLLRRMPNLKVDVHKPEIVLEIEIRDKVYIYSTSHKALGGMPYGVAGRSVVLMSGGIDSPVAAFQMARRGVDLILLHFHSSPFTSEMALEKVRSLTKRLTYYTGPLKLYTVNLASAQIALRDATDERYFTILQRRLMTRIADRLAQERGALSLTTGENLAQVASQTMEGIFCTNEVATRPIFRPLISFDKEDIIRIAKSIETFETSILPYEDCCTVFLPEKVATRPRLEDVLAEEAKVDIEAITEACFHTIQREIIK